MTIEVGHGPDRVRSAVTADRIIVLRSIGPDGTVNHLPDLTHGAGAPDIRMSFAKPGVYAVELETNHAFSDLPAIRFNDYARSEGLMPELELRARTRTTEADGRELYSRRAKALIQVGQSGGAPQPWVMKPQGATLEIVPDRNPYEVKPGDPLPVHVLFEGRPLAGGLVMLTNLEFDFRPTETHLTDAQGRAVFKMPRDGTWLLNVLWTKPLHGDPHADFDTTFASLTFGR